MKKALIVSLCFIFAGLLLVNGTFAMPNMDKVFADLTNWLDDLGIPVKDGEGTAVDVDLVSDETPQNLFPGSTASRSFYVKNSGSEDVYFRLVYAIQYDAGTWDKLTISFIPGDGFTEETDPLDGFENGWKDIYIGSTPYKMKVFTYKVALDSKAESSPVQITIKMDTAVTSEQIASYRSDFLQTQVLAIETDAFTAEKGYNTARDALDAALPLKTLNPF